MDMFKQQINRNLNSLQNELSEMFGIKILRNTRKREYVTGRLFFYKYARSRFKYTHQAIAEFAGRDHSTVTTALKSFDSLASVYPDFKARYHLLSSELDGILKVSDDEQVRDFMINFIRYAQRSQVEKLWEFLIHSTPDLKLEHLKNKKNEIENEIIEVEKNMTD